MECFYTHICAHLGRGSLLKVIGGGPYITPALSLMIKVSLQTLQIPYDWRRVIVTPVVIAPHTTGATLFRPISLLFAKRLKLFSRRKYFLTGPSFPC